MSAVRPSGLAIPTVTRAMATSGTAATRSGHRRNSHSSGGVSSTSQK